MVIKKECGWKIATCELFATGEELSKDHGLKKFNCSGHFGKPDVPFCCSFLLRISIALYRSRPPPATGASISTPGAAVADSSLAQHSMVPGLQERRDMIQKWLRIDLTTGQPSGVELRPEKSFWVIRILKD